MREILKTQFKKKKYFVFKNDILLSMCDKNYVLIGYYF